MGNEELHALYEEKLRSVSTSSFNEIRSVAVKILKERYDEPTRDGFYDDLDRGVAIIDREELLWQYLWSFGRMHQSKMNMALDKLPRLADIVKDGFSVIDWGCGQGLWQRFVCSTSSKARGSIPCQKGRSSSSPPNSR